MSVSITIATVLETGFDQLSGKVASSLPKKKSSITKRQIMRVNSEKTQRMTTQL